MSMFEKVCILGSLGAVGLFSVYSIFAPSKNKLKKEEIQQKRQKLVNDDNMRVLYSTMTFFYLQGFEQEKLQSFHNLYDILQISKPKLVALQLSEKEYEEKYQAIINHPQYPELMRKVDFYLQTKSEEIKNMQELDLKHLEKLYIFDYCKKNKCQVLFCDKSPSELRAMYQAKLQLSKLHLEENKDIPSQLKELYSEDLKKFDSQAIKKQKQSIQDIEKEIKKEIYEDFRYNFFVDKVISELQPKTSLIPSNPYKTLVGLVEPEDLEGITKLWKNKFKTTYGHEILEDEEALNRRMQKQNQQPSNLQAQA
ncbi:transmembrane protein, putative (macronuclear) [Tetrahymena thermophila SB210]|uniref:Transmembrane protein, putative n=1 Tax=Tetrahymena thermophila (strain SB210) TaxID=312017 RepID=A4VCY8_TETTS|nr:transmembrane protein, putative [Tetrahymena thermophila SB210]EDK31396.1 transmembrane protein, putative [Tetrahymena thermophila SB210]|eukprot:XP_001470642.1 transmembrane protein, putative [Tetrahymena thermophila SB210]